MTSLARRVELFVLQHAKVILVPSAAIEEKICKEFPIDPTKVHVVKDGPSSLIMHHIQDKEKGAHIRHDLGIPKQHKVIIYTGFINNIAGIEVLLEATKLLTAYRNDFSVIIIGFPKIEEYVALAGKLGISEIVKFIGKVDYFEISDYLDCADIAVAPKISEAEGNSKIITYFAAGLPVVCFDTSTNREIAWDLALYAKEKTAPAFAETLEQAIGNLRELREASKARKEFVRTHYSWDGIIKFVDESATHT